MKQSVYIGLDIGTTTVSGVVVNTESGMVLESRTAKSEAAIPSRIPGEKCQDHEKIRNCVLTMLDTLLQGYPHPAGIGLTGQMHGIVYLNKAGDPVSPLYTWQDQRGGGCCDRIRQRTGYQMAPGYGLATHLALAEAGQLPLQVWKVCTIMDYLAYVLCGRERLMIHATNAASLGLFDLKTGIFDTDAFRKLGIDEELLPEVTRETVIQGRHRGIPVAVAIGDNQASFLGTVARPEAMALANFGTGSQISVLSHSVPDKVPEGLEVRPFLGDSYLLCGSALCGGRAYALLEAFFRSFAVSCGMEDKAQYGVLNTLALEGLTTEDIPKVETTFCGTRADPARRGRIAGLSEDNFTPAALAAGTLLGMAEELKEMLEKMPRESVAALAMSGNGVRENPALRLAAGRIFAADTMIPIHREEAAFGAAMFAACACGENREALLQRCVRYQTDS